MAEDTPAGPGAVKIFDLTTGQPTAAFQGPKQVVSCLALSPDGKVPRRGQRRYAGVRVEPGREETIATLKEHESGVLGVAFSPDGKSLVTSGLDKSWRVWEVGTWKPLYNKWMQDDAVRRCTFCNPSGEQVAIAIGGRSERSVRIRHKEWDNGHLFKILDTAPAFLKTCVRIPQGNKVYVACSDKTVKVFTANNWEPAATLTGHDDWVYALAATADGTKLVSAGGDGTVKLWSTADNALLATLLQLTPRSDEWLFVTGWGILRPRRPPPCSGKRPTGSPRPRNSLRCGIPTWSGSSWPGRRSRRLLYTKREVGLWETDFPITCPCDGCWLRRCFPGCCQPFPFAMPNHPMAPRWSSSFPPADSAARR